MGWLDAAEGLLSGPRGRRLCWTLLDAGDHPGWARVRQESIAGGLTAQVRDESRSPTISLNNLGVVIAASQSPNGTDARAYVVKALG